jgi:hypothetical protein
MMVRCILGTNKIKLGEKMSKIAFNSNPLGTGTFTIASPNSNSDRTFTLPDTTGTVLTSAGGTITGDVTINVGSGSRIFQTVDANSYARFTQSSGSAQVGLFRTGAPSGGMYIGGDGDQFSVWSSGFQRRLNVSQAGIVTMPQQPAFSTIGTNYSQATGAFSIVIGASVQTNTGSHYNTGTGVFTAPVAGFYIFGFYGLSYPHNTEINTMGYFKNGTLWQGNQFGGASHNHEHASGTLGVYLNASDTIDLRYYRSSGSAYAYASQWQMWGYLAG